MHQPCAERCTLGKQRLLVKQRMQTSSLLLLLPLLQPACCCCCCSTWGCVPAAAGPGPHLLVHLVATADTRVVVGVQQTLMGPGVVHGRHAMLALMVRGCHHRGAREAREGA
jgi:hypothetical protein